MCVCMHVCVCVFACAYVSLWVCVCVRVHVHAHGGHEIKLTGGKLKLIIVALHCLCIKAFNILLVNSVWYLYLYFIIVIY